MTTQDVLADGEIDWTQTIEHLVASPRQDAVVPRNMVEMANLANCRGDRGALAVMQDAFAYIDQADIGAHLEHPSPWPVQSTYHGVIASTLYSPYIAESSTHGMSNEAFQPSTSSRRLVDHIKAGSYDISGDDMTVCRQINAAFPTQLSLTNFPVTHTLVTQEPLQDIKLSQQQQHPLTDPAWLEDALRNNIMPTYLQASMDTPLYDPLHDIDIPQHGVIRFVNPPFYVTRAEVLAALGRNAQVAHQPAGSPYHAIHILMERDTGKTQDVFVEVSTVKEARTIYTQFQRRAQIGRSLTLGNARAQVELSSQSALMHAIFPQARKVMWQGAKPAVDLEDDYYFPGVKAVGFDGFLGDEETALLCKWLDSPSRSPFAQRCQNRPYESTISLLHKYPLDNQDNIRMGDRKRLFVITKTAIKQLSEVLHSGRIPDGLGRHVLQELVVAAFSHPIFADQQKAALLAILDDYAFNSMVTAPGMLISLGGTHEFASRWPFLTLQRKPGVSDKLMRFFVKLIPNRVAGAFCFNEPFYRLRLPYHCETLEQLCKMSWRECLRFESDFIHAVLRKKLR